MGNNGKQNKMAGKSKNIPFQRKYRDLFQQILFDLKKIEQKLS